MVHNGATWYAGLGSLSSKSSVVVLSAFSVPELAFAFVSSQDGPTTFIEAVKMGWTPDSPQVGQVAALTLGKLSFIGKQKCKELISMITSNMDRWGPWGTLGIQHVILLFSL